MGTWGAGVYQSDHALNFFDEMTGQLVREIVFHLADKSLTGRDPDHYGNVPAAVDILASWCEHAHSIPGVSKEVVRGWRERYLQQFEASPYWDNATTPTGENARTERRKVIEATFDRLEAVAHDED